MGGIGPLGCSSSSSSPGQVGTDGAAADRRGSDQTLEAGGGVKSDAGEDTRGNVGVDVSSLDLSCTWTLTTEEKCKYGRALLPSGTCTSVPATDDRNSHQSVLVELRPAVGAIPPAGSFFSVQSAAADVDFVVVP
jgi:hypothetical protein